MFGLTTHDDNRESDLTAALSKRVVPDQPTPTNSSHQPRAFIVETGKPRTIVAFDLAAGKTLWKVDADVQSRIAVGGDFVVELEGKQLVARDQARGAIRWKAPAKGTYLGVAADKDRAYATWKDGGKYVLVGYDGGSGNELWAAPTAEGALGAPSAQGGVVFVPFFNQWLSILDGKTGTPLARLRGLDEQISMLRVTSQTVYYGSKQGVFRLDGTSVTGKRDRATYGQVKIPPQLEHTTYGVDAYDPIQLGYTAADRSRVLWQAQPSSEGPMKFVGDGYAIHYFRYVLGFDMKGEIRWAYSHPRVELVASDHTGYVILAVSANGEVVAIEPNTGAVRARESIGGNEHVLGATFDADGWSPSNQNEPIETVAALVSITRDHDARFDRVKELAVKALAKMPGPEVTKQLLGVLADNRAPIKLKDTVAELLVDRKDPDSLPVLTAQLAVHTDYIAKTEPESLGEVAKAIAGLEGVALDPKLVADALVALQSHLDAAATTIPDLVNVIGAMAAIGKGAERTALWSHLLLYHADEEVGGNASWDKAIVAALETKGGPGERELLRQVEADPRTRPSLASTIRDALGSLH